MLTRQAKDSLKQFCSLTGYSEKPFTFYNGETVFFTVEDESTKIDLWKYSGEINSILRMLSEEGYLRIEGTDLTLTAKGLHREYIEWAQFKDFIYRSVFTPIAVSTITTLITLWLTT